MADAGLIGLTQGDAPATVPSGLVRLYAKNDKRLYWKDDAGTERQIVYAGTWINATYQNNWETYPGYEPVGYMQMSGMCFLKGMCRQASGGASGSTIATLPEGFRPTLGAVIVGAFGYDSGYKVFCVEVNTGGAISVYNTPLPAWVSLAGLFFPIGGI